MQHGLCPLCRSVKAIAHYCGVAMEFHRVPCKYGANAVIMGLYGTQWELSVKVLWCNMGAHGGCCFLSFIVSQCVPELCNMCPGISRNPPLATYWFFSPSSPLLLLFCWNCLLTTLHCFLSVSQQSQSLSTRSLTSLYWTLAHLAWFVAHTRWHIQHMYQLACVHIRSQLG